MQRLEEEVRRIADAHSGACTVAVTDLLTGGHFGIGEDALMPTASLIKVPVLAALYQAVDAGEIRLDQRVTYGEHHRSLGSGVLSLMAPGAEMTVRDAAMLMIVISDNSATNMCIDLAGIEQTNARMRSLGLRKTTLYRRLGDRSAGLDARKMSVSTAGEMATLHQLIAEGKAASAESCADMLRIMRRLQGRAELSRLLPWTEMNMLPEPREHWVAEKGGSFIHGVRTGGAIFRTPHGFVAMAAFCEGGSGQGTAHNAEGNVTLGRLGKAVWDALCVE